jgi:hypothetical protein
MKNATHEISHFEIPAKDPEKLRNFYTNVFGWKFSNTAKQDMQYWSIKTGTKHIPGVNGGMYKKGSENQTVVNYISTPSIDESMAEIEKEGGHITVGKKEIEGEGFTAVGVDPEGNAIGLFESKNNGVFKRRGTQSQSGADRIRSKHRNDTRADSK